MDLWFLSSIFVSNHHTLLKSSYSALVEAGTDEAGRGCLAGPVTAAAVILPKHFNHQYLNDSKMLKASSRFDLRKIIEAEALSYAVAHVFPEKIDQINILNASIMAMHQALEKLHTEPQFVVVDGNRFKPFRKIPYSCIIKGDAKYQSIAAASILAKTYRDEFMDGLHEKYEVYNWRKNKGYPTAEHREAIKRYGITEFHRKSFRLLPEQLKLEL